MTVKLWTAHFIRICIANLLLFTALYMLLPILSIEIAKRCDISFQKSNCLYFTFIIGMFLFGLFHAYLIDAYKRKHVYMLSFAVMMITAIGYMFISEWKGVLLLSAVQGGALGMSITAGVTLAIDLTNSSLRSAGNKAFAWISHFGMIIGIILGLWIYSKYAFNNILLTFIITGSIGILITWGIYVPFRAPIVTKIFSFDRFLLFRGLIPSINLLLVTFVIGMLVSPVQSFSTVMLGEEKGIIVPVFIGVSIGFIIALLLSHLKYLKNNTINQIEIGLILEIVSFFLLDMNVPLEIFSIILGIGIGFAVPDLLMMFVKLSHHCQRGTANTTYLLFITTGICLGITVGNVIETGELPYIGKLISISAFLFFLFVTYPYYKRMKVR